MKTIKINGKEYKQQPTGTTLSCAGCAFRGTECWNIALGQAEVEAGVQDCCDARAVYVEVKA